MPQTPQALLERLDDIGRSLARSGRGLALLGLGSCGTDLARLDAYSDLDFFSVVQPGSKERFLQDLSWLSDIAPVGYVFRNTADGYKLLFSDGIFCEFAVFEPEEVARAVYTAGRIVWQAADFVAERWLVEGERPSPTPIPANADWLVGEALTNLYVGLGRFQRGEKLSAMRFIQGYAVDRLIELTPLLETAQPTFPDPFAAERRLEQRFPQLAQQLPAFMPGYDHSPAAACAILTFLEQHFPVNPTIKAAIVALCGLPETGNG
ncbi:MAG: hypothetical protein IPM39_07375 [Chloroflexi bacterium]|nr:hypothetical protein [Chloroflexota bacterium]